MTAPPRSALDLLRELRKQIASDYFVSRLHTTAATNLLSEIDARLAAGAEPVACKHEPFEGRCVHCNAPYVNGRAVIPPSPQPSEAAPLEIGSRWQHKNGNYYTVDKITNRDSTRQEDYPVTVVYHGDNGKEWSRKLSDWHRSMTFVAAAPSPAESGWRAIETAPRDGTSILFLHKEPSNGDVIIGFWHEHQNIPGWKSMCGNPILESVWDRWQPLPAALSASEKEDA